MAMKDSDKKIPNEDQKAAEHAKMKGKTADVENEKAQDPKKTGTAGDHRPGMQEDDTKVQNPNRNLPKGGNPVGRDTAQHNSVSGGKSLQGNNARSNPTSDKNHN